jgi:hypothetical protein
LVIKNQPAAAETTLYKIPEPERRSFMDAKQRRRLAEIVAGTAQSHSTPTAVDYALFPPAGAGAVVRQVVAGVHPRTDAIIDTTTPAGMGLAQLHLDPLAEAYCAHLDQHHRHDDNHGLPHGFLGHGGHDNHGLPHGFLSGHHDHDGDGDV